ncbi:hypothetical protein EG329_014362 [Mollisiaceae sp. DMI_Dod_QoI]|nr:hypothetical protein EG329_014362 [Helotiales sp. DMI_Dod_QoI]
MHSTALGRREVGHIKSMCSQEELYHFIKTAFGGNVAVALSQKILGLGKEDAQAAFAGITTVLASSFPYGFMCGLPALFFDVALCWQPFEIGIRRRPRVKSATTEATLPSWSWVGWQTHLSGWLWANTYVKEGPHRSSIEISQKFVAKFKWYSRAFNSTELHPIDGPQLLQTSISEAQKADGWLPVGWQRLKYRDTSPPFDNIETSGFHTLPPEYIFKHESQPQGEGILCQRAKILVTVLRHSRILYSAAALKELFCISAKGTDWKWAGIIQLNAELEWPVENLEGSKSAGDRIACELVMISEGHATEGSTEPGMNEWTMEERPKSPKGNKYEFYNVLWVEWEEGIAYRKGCGRVMKSAWEAQNLEWIDLTLG